MIGAAGFAVAERTMIEAAATRLSADADDLVVWAMERFESALAHWHPWPVRRDSLGRPDRLLIDLDPQPGTGFADAVLVARELRTVLAEHGLEGFPKASGGRGLHVIAPIPPRPWREVQAAREAIGREVAFRLPGLATMERLKRDRGARVYLDCGPQTVASAYSIRPGALVSAPVGWDELDAVAPEDFDVTTMPERFARLGDLHGAMP